MSKEAIGWGIAATWLKLVIGLLITKPQSIAKMIA